MTLRLRCQSKKGQQVIQDLAETSTVGCLKDKIAALTTIPRECLTVKQGYPPKVLDLSDESRTLSALCLRSGDTLIVEENAALRKQQQQQTDSVLVDQISMASGILMRKVVPADNSCLFTSVDCVMHDGKVDLTSAEHMRQLIANVVKSDPKQFDNAILGKSNKSYCEWIMKKDSWGGAIEVSILSKHYGVEIAVVDTQSGRIDRFGEDQHYARRVLVIYDGVHYDPLIMEPLVAGGEIQTIFPTSDGAVLAQAMDIANEAKQSRQFTDVGSFTLRCLICQKSLRGQSEAQSHAKETGHINFGEY